MDTINISSKQVYINTLEKQLRSRARPLEQLKMHLRQEEAIVQQLEAELSCLRQLKAWQDKIRDTIKDKYPTLSVSVDIKKKIPDSEKVYISIKDGDAPYLGFTIEYYINYFYDMDNQCFPYYSLYVESEAINIQGQMETLQEAIVNGVEKHYSQLSTFFRNKTQENLADLLADVIEAAFVDSPWKLCYQRH